MSQNILNFSPQFDLTKDLVITIDYYTDNPVLSGNYLNNPQGGLLIGLYDTNSSLDTTLSSSSISGLNYSPTYYSYTSGMSAGIIGVGFDFDGVFTANATGNLVPNSITVQGPYISSFPVIVNTGIIQSLGFEQSYFFGSNIPKRLRVRFTDFGNTLYVDDFVYNTQTFRNILSQTWNCSFSSVGVYVSYAFNNSYSSQNLYIQNINLNGSFTSSFIALSTH